MTEIRFECPTDVVAVASAGGVFARTADETLTATWGDDAGIRATTSFTDALYGAVSEEVSVPALSLADHPWVDVTAAVKGTTGCTKRIDLASAPTPYGAPFTAVPARTAAPTAGAPGTEIGRASCRERVSSPV